MTQEKEKRHCLECKTEIYGRSDKKFCSDYCRNEQHNKVNRDATNYMRKVNNVLRKNRRILEKFNPNGKSKVKESTLMEEGYNFAYHTNVYNTKKGGKYYFCYDQGYLDLGNEWFALVVKKEYV